ncbi:MAG: hypothetical protein ISS91_01290 [Candidatus Omnitrophica bacterium]|nr:hypothetical protein [Candidatus Omnitrophota bacterium]
MTNGETKNEKFKRLASKRVTNAIKKIELIGHLSASSYECTQEEVDKIVVALQDALEGIKAKFSKTKKADASKFQL